MAEILLVPKRAPGRRSRKAGAYGAEIRRLAALGYTHDTIRETLEEVGILVSRSTVQREASRPPWPPSSRRPVQIEASRPPVGGAAASSGADPGTRADHPALDGSLEAGAVASATAGALTSAGNRPSSRDIAAAFFETHNGNPLFRKDKP
ncbi:hypothetical protein [Pelomonas sp. Root1444]|uniref:hypothetical protein n=1 Tax=Pelomonas sp. Root1444 TaxID=1736464 RepID=UPI0012F9B3D9|nr:hypothetical protein [Pelomonas sp. Root1444]